MNRGEIHYKALNKLQVPEFGRDISKLIPTKEQVLDFAEENISRARAKYGSKSLESKCIEDIIERSLDWAQHFEIAARSDKKWEDLRTIADSVPLISTFSAAGTTRKRKKKDPYENKPFAHNGDNQTTSAAAQAGITIAGAITHNDFSDITESPFLTGYEPNMAHRRLKVHQALQTWGGLFLYYGNEEECHDVNWVVNRKESYIPKELVRISSCGIKDTQTQVLQLGVFLRDNVQTPDNQQGILRNGSTVVLPIKFQALRTLSMMMRYDTIPPGIKIAVLPLASPERGLDFENGVQDYIKDELSKILYCQITNMALDITDPLNHRWNQEHLLLLGR